VLLREAALAYQEQSQRPAGREPSREGYAGSAEHAEVFEDLHRTDAGAAKRLAQALLSLPRVGSSVLGFSLRAEVRRGAVGRVCVAEQCELANRFVVLKIAPDLVSESRTLAQLHHPNVVPLYSVHQAGPFQAFCMPYFGATTLGHVLKDLHAA